MIAPATPPPAAALVRVAGQLGITSADVPAFTQALATLATALLREAA